MRRSLALALALGRSAAVPAPLRRSAPLLAPALPRAPAPRRPFAAAAALEPANALMLEVLTSASQWRVVEEAEAAAPAPAAAAGGASGDGDNGEAAPPLPRSRLRKAFELADARTAARFEAQARDLNLRLARRGLAPLHVAARGAAAAAPPSAAAGAAAVAAGGDALLAAATAAAAAAAAAAAGSAPVHVVEVRVAWPAGAAAAALTQREVDAAMAADAVGAELQLAGKWG